MKPPSSYSYRFATTENAVAIFNCVNLAYTVEKNGGSVSFKCCDRYLSIQDVYDALQTGTYFCCFDSKTNEIIAAVYYTLTPPIGYFGPLAVLPSYQNQSLGKTLIKHVETTCQDHGCTHIDIIVASPRTDLFPFYHKLGYATIQSNIPASNFNLTTSQLTKQLTMKKLRKCLTKLNGKPLKR